MYIVRAFSPGGARMHEFQTSDLFSARGMVSNWRSQGLMVSVQDERGAVIPL